MYYQQQYAGAVEGLRKAIAFFKFWDRAGLKAEASVAGGLGGGASASAKGTGESGVTAKLNVGEGVSAGVFATYDVIGDPRMESFTSVNLTGGYIFGGQVELGYARDGLHLTLGFGLVTGEKLAAEFGGESAIINLPFSDPRPANHFEMAQKRLEDLIGADPAFR